MTHHPWTMAYWYAAGRNDERAGYPSKDPVRDYTDPCLFADWYDSLVREYRDPQSDRHSLACLPDCFTEWLEDQHAR